jgi:hypothetical protein
VPYILEPWVEREIERTFAPEHVDYVRRKLREQELPRDSSAPAPRVHVAVLWLAKGDITRFDYELAGACCDWRDTLLAAGLANEDWKSVLTQKGIDCHDW